MLLYWFVGSLLLFCCWLLISSCGFCWKLVSLGCVLVVFYSFFAVFAVDLYVWLLGVCLCYYDLLDLVVVLLLGATC